MKNNKFIDYNSTIIDVEELAYANIEARVVTMVFKHSPLSINLRFKTEEAMEFIRKIFNAGKRDIDKPQRKRGRPRKKYTSLEVKPKRPVGRPRKNKG